MKKPAVAGFVAYWIEAGGTGGATNFDGRHICFETVGKAVSSHAYSANPTLQPLLPMKLLLFTDIAPRRWKSSCCRPPSCDLANPGTTTACISLGIGVQ
jgi:hypothetical protein